MTIAHVLHEAPWCWTMNPNNLPNQFSRFVSQSSSTICRTTPGIGSHFSIAGGQGIPNLKTGRMTLEKELKEFHEYHKKVTTVRPFVCRRGISFTLLGNLLNNETIWFSGGRMGF